jgi:membrane-associated phospholipid phosphatase
MPLFPKLIANAINPLSALLLLAAPFATRRRTGIGEFWGRCVLGVGVAVLLAESGKRWEVWHGHPSFPSGHETFCLAAMTCLAVRDPRWLGVGLPLSLLMAWALVAARFHTPIDVAGALLTGPGPALLCQLYKRRPNG